MAGMAEAQRNTFHARIKKIHKGGPNTMGHILVGSQDDSSGGRAKTIKFRRGKSFLARLGSAFADLALMPMALILGGIAMVLGMTAMYHAEVAGLIEITEGSIWSYAEIVAALLIAAGLGHLTSLTKGARKVGLIGGVALVYVVQAQLIAAYPEPFAWLMPENPSLTLQAAEFLSL